MLGITKNEFIEMLEDGVVTVTFTKINGETRVMPCTLHEAIVPPVEPKVLVEGQAPRKRDPNVISVWCLDKQEWRSFRWENVVGFQFHAGGGGVYSQASIA